MAGRVSLHEKISVDAKKVSSVMSYHVISTGIPIQKQKAPPELKNETERLTNEIGLG